MATVVTMLTSNSLRTAELKAHKGGQFVARMPTTKEDTVALLNVLAAQNAVFVTDPVTASAPTSVGIAYEPTMPPVLAAEETKRRRQPSDPPTPPRRVPVHPHNGAAGCAATAEDLSATDGPSRRSSSHRRGGST